MLVDPQVDQSVKDKIQEILQAKEYFYDYFSLPAQKIYSKVKFLESEAVSYLVVASAFDRVQAHQVSFPFWGEFPYLGFFKRESALRYQQKLIEQDYYTYLRPVYAYSTLGYFQDRILSSFFIFEKEDLAELIFHELFHTIFFAKDEVNFNENLADFFAGQLVLEYFSEQKEEILQKRQKQETLKKKVVMLSNQYGQKLKENPPQDKEHSDQRLKEFLEQSFLPQIKKLCTDFNLKKCSLAKGEWNNARFAAYLTYHESSDFIEKIYQNEGHDLRQMLSQIQKHYQDYGKTKFKKFEDYLKEIYQKGKS